MPPAYVEQTCFNNNQMLDHEVNKFEQVSSDGHLMSLNLDQCQGVPELQCSGAMSIGARAGEGAV